jgi:hypothetical protein
MTCAELQVCRVAAASFAVTAFAAARMPGCSLAMPGADAPAFGGQLAKSSLQ